MVRAGCCRQEDGGCQQAKARGRGLLQVQVLLFIGLNPAKLVLYILVKLEIPDKYVPLIRG